MQITGSTTSLTFANIASILITDGTLKVENGATVSLANGMNITVVKGSFEFINASIIINSSSTLKGKIELKTGTSGKIANTTCQFGTGGSLKMEAKTKLDLFSGSILKYKGISKSGVWDGIVAIGSGSNHFTPTGTPTATLNSPAAWLGTLMPDITLITMSMGASIKEAKVGVNLINGAAIRARGAVFDNCEKGIYFKPWRGSGNQFANNASFIMTSTFNWFWNANVSSFINKSELVHITLDGVGAINMGGNNFKNEIPAIGGSDCPNERGIGIKSIKSDFNASRDGDRFCNDDMGCPDNCFASGTSSGNLFKQLGIGVRFIGSEDFSNKLSVRFSDFQNCATGLYIENSADANVGENTYFVDNGKFNANFQNRQFCSDYLIKFIETFDVDGLRVYKCTTTTSRLHVDIISMLNSVKRANRNECVIRNNVFEDLYVQTECPEDRHAIVLSGDHDNRNIVCNSFEKFSTDILVNGSSRINDIPDKEATDNLTYGSVRGATNKLSLHSTGSFLCDINIVNNGNAELKYNYWSSQSVMNNFVVTPPGGSLPNITQKAFTQNYAFNGNSITITGVNCPLVCNDLLLRTVIMSTEDISQNIFTVYPNPASSELAILLKTAQKARASLYTITGTEVGNYTLQATENTIDVSAIAEGVYILTIISNGGIQSSKIVIRH